MKTFNNERMKKVCLFFCKIFFLLLIICFFLRYKDAFKSDFKNLYNLYKIKREIKNTIKSNYKGVDKVKYKSASHIFINSSHPNIVGIWLIFSSKSSIPFNNLIL